MKLVLVGMMGAGKTTVGRLVAEKLDIVFVDSDAQVEAATGRTVPEIFAADGEAAFRAEERRALDAALAAPGDAVIAAAGGVVLDPDNRAALGRAGCTVVWLDAHLDALAARVGTGEGRPLLGDDPRAALAGLAQVRRPLYAEVADQVIAVDGLEPVEVAARIIESWRPAPSTDDGGPDGLIRVPVDLAERSYEVLVGDGARHRLASVVPPGARRAAIVTQPGVNVDVDAGIEQQVFVIPDGEEAKSIATVEELCRQFARWGLTRADVVVAVGGGVVTDTAGFAAAIYLRGVAVIHVSTTLLGQVDAAIGGKTGVNLPEGKNLVGAFWQPAAVLCDTEVLAGLPPREHRSGLGEMAKYHFLLGKEEGAVLAHLPLAERVARCVAHKAEVVGGDEREGGRRATLNYGHTLAHALETVGHYDLRHGEAVAIGLMFAALLAERLGRIDTARVDEHRRVVAAYDLPLALPPGVDRDALLTAMARDKKAVHGLTFVLDGPAGVEAVAVEPDVVAATLADFAATGGA